MRVVIRKRKGGKNGFSLVLDIHYEGRRKRITLPTTDMAAAKRMAEQVERQLLTEGWGKAVRSKATIDEFMSDFLAVSRSTKASKTWTTDRNALKRLRESVGNVPMLSLTTNHIEQFKLNELTRVRPTSLNIYLRHIKSALAFGVRNGYLNANPASSVQLCRVPMNNVPRYLTELEIEKLRKTPADNLELLRMIDFGLRTGARRSELINVQWADVDLDRGIVYIRNRADFTTKSKRSRVIPMNDRLREMLTEMQAAGPKPDDRVFSMSYWRFGASFRVVVRKAGLPASITPHVLRHTFASFLIIHGTPLATLRELLGHADISTSLLYTHLTEGHLSDSVNRLPFCGRAPPFLLPVLPPLVHNRPRPRTHHAA